MSNQEKSYYQEFLKKTQLDENRPAALQDIKDFLDLKTPEDAVLLIKSAGLNRIIKCLDVENKIDYQLACDVLKICFEKFKPGDIIKNYTGNFMYLLRHDKNCPRLLAVEEVYKVIITDPALLPLPQYIDVFVAVAQLILDKDISVSNKAMLIISHLPNEAYPKVLEELKTALDYCSSSKCNAYEVVINISLRSNELLNLCIKEGYFDFMIKELQSDDVLYILNILELLSTFAIKPQGINYLVQSRHLSRIEELVADLPHHPLNNLLAPGYIKFFGSIGHHYPKEVIEKLPLLVNSLFEALEGGNLSLLPIAIDTLGFVGTSIEGKLSLAACGSRYILAVQKVCTLIKTGTTEEKIRALNCLTCLISVHKDPLTTKASPTDQRVILMTREWFRSLGTDAIGILFNFCKNPFPDINFASYSLLDAICQHQWGQEFVARTAGFVEYLLDRSVENDKETKEIKYEIIKRLAQSLTFDSNMLSKLQDYVDKGPFYSEARMEVAMDEMN